MSDPKFSTVPNGSLPDAATVPEKRVSVCLGIGRDALRAWRKANLASDDWTDAGQILWSAAAVKKCAIAHSLAVDGPEVLSLLAVVSSAPLPPAPPVERGEASSAASAEKPAPAVLLVWNARVPNRRVLEAYVPGKDPLDPAHRVIVRVDDNRRFDHYDASGQPVQIRALLIGPQLFEHVP